jgi:hypothetical protein
MEQVKQETKQNTANNGGKKQYHGKKRNTQKGKNVKTNPNTPAAIKPAKLTFWQKVKRFFKNLFK